MWPIAHLLIAAGYAQHHPALAADPDYYLGAIAPDAIHFRPGVDIGPEKKNTHLRTVQGSDGMREARAYWRKVGETPFDVGYGLHVISDRLWTRFYPGAFPGLMRADGHTEPGLYQPDAAWVDRMLYFDEARALGLPGLLAEANAPTAHPLLRQAEIVASRDRLLADYTEPVAPPAGKLNGMDYNAVQAFVANTGAIIHRLLQT